MSQVTLTFDQDELEMLNKGLSQYLSALVCAEIAPGLHGYRKLLAICELGVKITKELPDHDLLRFE